MQSISIKTDLALALSRHAMLQAAAEGIAIGQWRDDVLFLCNSMGLPEPDDVIAWVSGGKASDQTVVDWEAAFHLK